jgi:hypothetical protein
MEPVMLGSFVMVRPLLLAGVLVILAPAIALAEAPPPVIQDASKKKDEPPKSGTILTGVSGEHEQTADEGGQIYVTRGYKGVVPGVREESAVPAKATKKDEAAIVRPMIEWIGFQPFATYSRVFIQVEGRFTFTVVRPKPDQIDVRIPGAEMSSANDLRQLITRAFPTAIDEITTAIQADMNSVVVSIKLKKPVGYLYRSEAKYIFVDVEM